MPRKEAGRSITQTGNEIGRSQRQVEDEVNHYLDTWATQVRKLGAVLFPPKDDLEQHCRNRPTLSLFRGMPTAEYADAVVSGKTPVDAMEKLLTEMRSQIAKPKPDPSRFPEFED